MSVWKSYDKPVFTGAASVIVGTGALAASDNPVLLLTGAIPAAIVYRNNIKGKVKAWYDAVLAEASTERTLRRAKADAVYSRGLNVIDSGAMQLYMLEGEIPNEDDRGFAHGAVDLYREAINDLRTFIEDKYVKGKIRDFREYLGMRIDYVNEMYQHAKSVAAGKYSQMLDGIHTEFSKWAGIITELAWTDRLVLAFEKVEEEKPAEKVPEAPKVEAAAPQAKVEAKPQEQETETTPVTKMWGPEVIAQQNLYMPIFISLENRPSKTMPSDMAANPPKYTEVDISKMPIFGSLDNRPEKILPKGIEQYLETRKYTPFDESKVPILYRPAKETKPKPEVPAEPVAQKSKKGEPKGKPKAGPKKPKAKPKKTELPAPAEKSEKPEAKLTYDERKRAQKERRYENRLKKEYPDLIGLLQEEALSNYYAYLFSTDSFEAAYKMIDVAKKVRPEEVPSYRVTIESEEIKEIRRYKITISSPTKFPKLEPDKKKKQAEPEDDEKKKKPGKKSGKGKKGSV
jgi:hypothetical protein